MDLQTVTAESVLSEIPSETLLRLLASVRAETSPPGSTRIPALDAHFLANGSHHASVLSSLNRGDVIEIQGPTASGKTHLVYHLLITCLLPPRFLGSDMKGWGKAAAVFDTDRTFDIQRFYTLLTSAITAAAAEGPNSSEPRTEFVEELATQCLQNLHIFRPTSTAQLAATVEHLPVYHSTHLLNSEIGLLAIDSISAFHWIDRYAAEQIRSDPKVNRAEASARAASPLHQVLVALQRFRLSHGPVIVMTNWGLYPHTGSSGTPSMFYRQHLQPFPSPFSEDPQTSGTSAANVSDTSQTQLPPITHHITLPSIPIPQLPAGITLQEAEEQEIKFRRELINKGEVIGLVRTPGSGRLGRFTFRITQNAVTT